MAKRNTFYKLGRMATIPTFTSLGLLLLLLYVPHVDRYVNTEAATAVIAGSFILFSSILLFGRIGLPAFLTGRMSLSIMPGLVSRPMPSLFARFVGSFYILLSFIGVLLGTPLLLSGIISLLRLL